MSKNDIYLASKPRYEILDGLRGVAYCLIGRNLLRYLHCGGSGMCALEREQDSLVPGEETDRFQCILVAYCSELDAAAHAEFGELGADAAVVQARADAPRRQGLSVFVQKEAALVALHDALAACVAGHAARILADPRPHAPGFGGNQAGRLFIDEGAEESD